MSNWFTTSSTASKSIFCIIVVYLIAAIIVLLMIFGVIPSKNAANNPYLLIEFSVVSFIISVIISVFHLSTLIMRRKRRSDNREGEI